MTTPTRREAVLAAVCSLAIVALVIWLPGRETTGPSTTRSQADGHGGVSLGDPSSFTIRGDVRGAVAPGAMVPLDLVLENPNDFELAITKITVLVESVDPPRADGAYPCSIADYATRQLQGDVRRGLAAHGQDHLSSLGVARSQWPAVGLINRKINQDGCKGAVLTLRYHATGAEVDQ